MLRSAGTEGGILNRFDLQLENLPSGMVDLQVDTGLGRLGAVHINSGSIAISPNVEWAITGDSFTNVKFADIKAAGVIDVTGLNNTTLTNQGLFVPGLSSPGVVTIQGDFL